MRSKILNSMDLALMISLAPGHESQPPQHATPALMKHTGQSGISPSECVARDIRRFRKYQEFFRLADRRSVLFWEDGLMYQSVGSDGKITECVATFTSGKA